ncbi:uncharacterized protein LOC134523321 [Chroicocephalus ridibundus]|uniref:uncharacterized protein LOC134523321 n=1 Tax=Chroicocephalus ridibundus TaxID=1192867 RepID=UPI002FDD6789
MEQIILSAITWHIQDNQVIRPSQHGFMKGRSCSTNLISFYEKVTCLADDGKAVDVVYLDFIKVFDMVSDSILMEKLAAHGLDRSTLRWLKIWLEGWAQRVVVNGVQSSWWLVTSGVPQGSVLWPVLFSIFINDLDKGIECTHSKFADDTKLGGVLFCLRVGWLYRGIWPKDNSMRFKKAKCQVLHLHHNNPMQCYRLGEDWLEGCPAEKDLGVLAEYEPAVCPGGQEGQESILAFIRHSVASSTRAVIVHASNSEFSFGPLTARKMVLEGPGLPQKSGNEAGKGSEGQVLGGAAEQTVHPGEKDVEGRPYCSLQLPEMRWLSVSSPK